MKGTYKMSKNQDLLDASEIGSIPGRKSKEDRR
jgi:hypothetical protein